MIPGTLEINKIRHVQMICVFFLDKTSQDEARQDTIRYDKIRPQGRTYPDSKSLQRSVATSKYVCRPSAPQRLAVPRDHNRSLYQVHASAIT